VAKRRGSTHDFRLQGTPGDNLAHATQAQDGLAVMLDQPLDGHEPSRLFFWRSVSPRAAICGGIL
jgi:hypothetical protein